MSDEKSKFGATVGDLKKFIEKHKLPDNMPVEVFNLKGRSYTDNTRIHIYHYDDGGVTLRIFEGG